ncbi:MAG: hypothetical protein NT013_12030 [Planctomycetia bacterium]|nr:hypothetical protein [Planctomycetia bacterium]
MINDQRPVTSDLSLAAPLAQALIAARWSPEDELLAASLQRLVDGDDLLPTLRDVAQRWMKRATTPIDLRQAQQLVRLHDWLATTSVKLTCGWPGGTRNSFASWTGTSLIWWPHGIPVGRKVAWVSSRLGRAIDERHDWFAVLRSAAAKLDAEQDLLLTSSSTTTGRFLERAATLFGLRLLRIQMETNRSLSEWLIRLRRELWQQCLLTDSTELLQTSKIAFPPLSLPQWNRASALRNTERATNVVQKSGDHRDRLSGIASAMISPANCVSSIDPDLLTLPLADRALLSAADQVVALQVRPQGNLHMLLKRRLREVACKPGSTWLALGDQLVPNEIAIDLQSLGAVGWYLWPKEKTTAEKDQGDENTPRAAVLRQVPWPEGSYLVHWTRRRFGPWPDQSTDEFMDDLLLSRADRSHSAFATLARIVNQRRLIASSSGLRGGFRVVCFSGTPLSEFPQKRIFRRHRGRWDFELFGLCINRDWLAKQGARPVIYGDEKTRPTLADSDKPFWQQRHTQSRDNAAAIDWSAEAEWRVPQDLDLKQAPPDAVLLFAPNTSEAQALSAISPWPIVALES